jgi:hypothetical protein
MSSPNYTLLTYNSVDFYLFGFDVDFGASPSPGPAHDLRQFWEMLHAPGPSVDSKNKPDVKRLQSVLTYDAHYDEKDKPGHAAAEVTMHEGAALKFALEDGNFPSPPAAEPKTDATVPAPPPGDPQSTGAGVKWFVKGGALRFRISTDFAISSASVTASTQNTKDGIQLPENPPIDTKIYSRPMRVSDPITSELHITVTSESTNEVIGGWRKPTLDIKAVPVATFGKYSIDTDPSHSNADSLLQHTDATVPLAMGLILSAPPPHLAESFIPVFKASDADKLGVRDFRFVIPVEDIGHDPNTFSDQEKKDAHEGLDWFLPRFEGPLVDGTKASNVVMAPVQDKFIPAETSAEVLAQSAQKRWDDMGATWEMYAQKNDVLVNGDAKGEVGILALYATMLGWDVQVPAKKPATTANVKEPWKLIGKFPSKTVREQSKGAGDIKHLEETYLWLPQIAVT